MLHWTLRDYASKLRVTHARTDAYVQFLSWLLQEQNAFHGHARFRNREQLTYRGIQETMYEWNAPYQIGRAGFETHLCFPVPAIASTYFRVCLPGFEIAHATY